MMNDDDDNDDDLDQPSKLAVAAVEIATRI